MECIRVKSHLLYSYHNLSSMNNLFRCNSIAGHLIATNLCTCHDSIAVMSCAKLCSYRYVRRWMGAKRNFHQLWIVWWKNGSEMGTRTHVPSINSGHVSTASVNQRRCYISNAFSHWLITWSCVIWDNRHNAECEGLLSLAYACGVKTMHINIYNQ